MPRRMRSSFGCVQQIGPGQWRIRWWEEVAGEYKRRSRNFRGTRREADRALAEIRAGLDENRRHRLRQVPTVAEAYERWYLPEMEQAVADGRTSRSTWANHRSKWNRYVGPRWGDTRVSEIDPLELQQWLLTMTRKPAKDALALLRKVLDYCQIYDVVGDNVARRPYRMPTAQTDRADGAYTLAELDRIAQAARGSYAEAAMLLCMFGSARTGEALGVRLEDVERVTYHSMTLAVAHVRRQVTPRGEVSETLKTRASARPLVIPEPWSLRLLELADEARGRGDVWLSDDGLQRPVQQRSYCTEWRRACEAAGVEVKQPRAARRSWETYMRWDMRVEQSRVEQLMGHALPGVTGTHYDKPTAPMFVEAVGEAFERRPFVSGDGASD